MNIVLDTNVLVSALWATDSKPADIVNAVLNRRFTACYDYRIINEYYSVLKRPKFQFSEWEIQSILEFITSSGISVVPDPIPDIYFPDKTDRKFYEVAAFCQARLITGNIKHYPQSSLVITVADFHKTYLV